MLYLKMRQNLKVIQDLIIHQEGDLHNKYFLPNVNENWNLFPS